MVVNGNFNPYGRNPMQEGKKMTPRHNGAIARALEDAILGKKNHL